jgi:uncharacterized phiE125 gp8 family phage protein
MQAHSRIDESTEQTYVEALITAARDHVERDTGQYLVTQTVEVRLDGFPAGGGTIVLPVLPIQAVTGFDYIDADGNPQSLVAGTDYQLDSKSVYPRLDPEPGVTWPATESGRRNAVTITCTAGYGAAGSDCPAQLVHAIKMLTAHWFEAREPIVTGTIVADVPRTVDTILANHRRRFEFGAADPGDDD